MTTPTFDEKLLHIIRVALNGDGEFTDFPVAGDKAAAAAIKSLIADEIIGEDEPNHFGVRKGDIFHPNELRAEQRRKLNG